MSIESMTGFARSEIICAGGARFVCEIRSVNGKSLDMRLRLPQGMERLESKVRQLIQSAVARGNLQLTLSSEELGASESLRVNQGLVAEILALAAALHERHGLGMPTVGELLSVRGVLETTATVESEEVDLAALQAVEAAVVALKEFRSKEGLLLKSLLLEQLEAIEVLAQRASSDASRSPEKIRERLSAQVQLLLNSGQGFDEQRLAMEAAILAAKADIREEIDRLGAHVAAARQLLGSDGPVGRKLDFLAQEFNREANTLCSKSNASSVTSIGLELKAVVDQFREQVQNLE